MLDKFAGRRQTHGGNDQGSTPPPSKSARAEGGVMRTAWRAALAFLVSMLTFGVAQAQITVNYDGGLIPEHAFQDADYVAHVTVTFSPEPSSVELQTDTHYDDIFYLAGSVSVYVLKLVENQHNRTLFDFETTPHINFTVLAVQSGITNTKAFTVSLQDLYRDKVEIFNIDSTVDVSIWAGIPIPDTTTGITWEHTTPAVVPDTLSHFQNIWGDNSWTGDFGYVVSPDQFTRNHVPVNHIRLVTGASPFPVTQRLVTVTMQGRTKGSTHINYSSRTFYFTISLSDPRPTLSVNVTMLDVSPGTAVTVDQPTGVTVAVTDLNSDDDELTVSVEPAAHYTIDTSAGNKVYPLLHKVGRNLGSTEPAVVVKVRDQHGFEAGYTVSVGQPHGYSLHHDMSVNSNITHLGPDQRDSKVPEGTVSAGAASHPNNYINKAAFWVLDDQAQRAGASWTVAPSSVFALHEAADNRVYVLLKGGVTLDYEAASIIVGEIRATTTSGDHAVGPGNFTLTVVDVDDVAPRISDVAGAITLTENQSYNANAGFTGGSIVVTDSDTAKTAFMISTTPTMFTMATGTGNDKEWTLAFSADTSLDHEVQAAYTVMVTVTDGGGQSAATAFTVEVRDVNETPVTTMPIGPKQFPLNQATTIDLGSYFTDPDGDDLTYTFSGTLAWMSHSGDMLVGNPSAAVAVMTATVTATDPDSESVTATFTYQAQANLSPVLTETTNSNQAVTLTDGETSQAADTGIRFTVTDGDGDDISLMSVTPADLFTLDYTVNSSTALATLRIKAGITLDADGSSPSLTATVSATDSANGTGMDTVVLTIVAVDDELPTISGLAAGSVDENGSLAADYPLPGGTVTVTDVDTADAALSVTLSGSSLFKLADTGDKAWRLELIQATVFNHEATGSYTLDITVMDGGGQTDTESYTLSISDLNDIPKLTATIANQVLSTARAATLDFSDHFNDEDGDTLTYSFTGTLAGWTASGSMLTFSSDMEVTVTATVTASDGNGGSTTADIVVEVKANQDPVVMETSGSRQLVALTDGQTSQAADTGIRFTVTDGDGNNISSMSVSPPDMFALDFSTSTSTALATLRIKAGIDLDADANNNPGLTATVTATDNEGGVGTRAVVLTITPVDDETPSITGLTSGSVDENATLTVGYALPGGGLTVTDADTDDGALMATHDGGPTFTLRDTGDKSWALEVATATSLDHETMPALTIMVTVVDGGGNRTTASYTLNVNDVNDAPTATGPIPQINYQTGETISTSFAGYFNDVDGDALTFTYSGTLAWMMDGGTNNDSLTGVAPTVVVSATTATVTVTDGDGETAELAFTFSVIDRDFTELVSLAQQPAIQVAAAVAADVGAAAFGRAGSAVASGATPALMGMLRTKAGELERGELSLEEFLAGNSFSFTAGALPGNLGNMAYWGGGHYSKLEAKSDLTTALKWDGSLFGGNFGLEARGDTVLFGLGFNHSRGKFDYEQMASGNTTNKGTLEISMNTVFPYFSYRTAQDIEIQAMVAVGRGEMEATEGAACNATGNELCYTSDLQQLSFLLGFASPAQKPGLKLRAELGGGQVKTENNKLSATTEALAAITSDTGHFELGVLYDNIRPHATVRPSLLLGVRRDFGDAAEGWGMEAGARLATDPAARLSFDTGIRYLQRKGGFREYGIDGTFRYQPRLANLGLSWEVQPGYGIELATHDLGNALGALADSDGLPAGEGVRLKARASYGLLVSDGLLTPSLSFKQGGDVRLYGLNLRYQVGAFSWTYGWTRDRDANVEQLARVDLKIQ